MQPFAAGLRVAASGCGFFAFFAARAGPRPSRKNGLRRLAPGPMSKIASWTAPQTFCGARAVPASGLPLYSPKRARRLPVGARRSTEGPPSLAAENPHLKPGWAAWQLQIRAS